MTKPTPSQDPSKRRDASANFVVQNTDADSTLDLRDAMETAHRSLADSLQLSFRALQLVMAVLVVLYLVSGFRTVEDSQTGVSTFFGKIIDDKGLAPGLHLNWPTPIGGFEIYNSQNRIADVRGAFKPRLDARLSPEQRISKSKSRDGLVPGVDGSLLTSNGDLAHLEITTEWEIIDPVQFSTQIPDSTSAEIIEAILEQAIIHVVAQITLEELIDTPLEELRALIRIEAQDTLNTLQCGIRISEVTMPSEPEPPYFIQRSYEAFDSARINAETTVERATAQAHETLIQAAGGKYEDLLQLIEQYELAVTSNSAPEKKIALDNINAMLDADEISGKVANTIASADGYRAQIESTLGQDFKRFKSLLPTYNDHPELVKRSRWLEMYSKVLGNPDAETIFVPKHISTVSLSLSGSDEIAQLRHRNALRLKESMTIVDGAMMNPWTLRAREIDLEGPSRELSISSGSVQGRQE